MKMKLRTFYRVEQVKGCRPLTKSLYHVVSDITGVTGLAIIKAILAGERDPQTLARLRDRRCKQDEVAMAHALHGTWREEHLFALQQALERYAFHHRQLAACDARIAAHLERFADRSGGEPLPPGAASGGATATDRRSIRGSPCIA